MVEKIVSKNGRTFLVEKLKNEIYIAADAFTGIGAQLFVQDCMKKAELQPTNYQKNILDAENNCILFGVGYKLPLFGRKRKIREVKAAIVDYNE